jgi:hypothetical protein
VPPSCIDFSFVQYVNDQVEVTLRLTVNISWYRVPLWDLRPDVIPGLRYDRLYHRVALCVDWLADH